MRKLFIILSAVLVAAASFGQNDKKMFELGDEAMKNGHYTSAVYYYSLVINKLAGGDNTDYMPFETVAYYKKPEKQEDGSIKPPSDPGKKEILAINKLADAYREAKDYKNAVVWYKSAMEHRLDEFPYVQYFYGVSLMKSDQFEEAIKEFEGVKSELNNPDHPIQQKAENRIISCEFALNPNNTDEGIEVNEMDSIVNAGSASFGFKRLQDDIFVFSSARKNPVDSVDMIMEEMDDFDRDFQKALGGENKKKKQEEYNPILDPLYMLDIYKMRELSAGEFEEPEKAKNNLSMPFIHEADLTISKDGKTAYFTRMDPLDHRNTKIYVSRNFNGKWMRPLALDSNVNKEGSRSMNPTLSVDGKTLYFASDRPGGEGGMDIWMTTINEDGVTTAPQNLGTNINTIEDEISPFYDGRSKNMYFASEGHIGFGGFDIYVATWNPDTDWFKKAKNMSAPINSSKDDAYYFLDEKTGIAYLSSDRNSCKECDENKDSVQISGNCFKIYDVSMPDIEFALEGVVYDEETLDPIPNPVITIKDIRGNRKDVIIRGDENGYYNYKLEANWEIYIRAQDEPMDYFAKADYAYTLGLTESTTIEKDFYLLKVPAGEIAIEGIEYDFDSANLRPKSKEVLDQLYKDWIEPNPSFTIEIRSHTDFRGSDTYNMTLSQARAQSVVDYLTETYGVSKERLLAKGYGETEPTTVELPNGEQVVLTEEYIKTKLQTYNEREEAHQRNRRTAFKVIR